MNTRLSILILVALAGVLFPFLFYVAVAAGGGGHGTALFWYAILSPINLEMPFVSIALALLFWLIVVTLVGFRRYASCRYVVVALLTIHYMGVVFACLQEDWSYVARVWHASPGFTFLFLIGYFGWQLVIWFFTFRREEAHHS